MFTKMFANSLSLRRVVIVPLIVALLTFTFGLNLALADTSYTVKTGDNLTKIARANNTTVDALIAANKAKYPCLATNAACLQIGWVITIPGGSGGSTTTGNTPSTYTVQAGDSLAKIAKKLGVNFNDLIAANKKDRPCLAAATPCALQIGWVLNVPGGTGQAAAPTPTPKPGATATPAATGNNGQLVVLGCQIKFLVVIFYGGQIVKQQEVSPFGSAVFDLPAGHYDVQFMAAGYFNLNLSYDIAAGEVVTQPIVCG